MCFPTFLISQPLSLCPTLGSKDPTWKLNISNWSSWTRLTRVSSYVYRFVDKCWENRKDRLIGPLTPEEIENVEVRIIHDAQRTEFAEEFRALQGSRAISKKSKLLKLTPKVDQDGLLRCDGRIQYVEFLPYDVRYPVILPRGSWITKFGRAEQPIAVVRPLVMAGDWICKPNMHPAIAVVRPLVMAGHSIHKLNAVVRPLVRASHWIRKLIVHPAIAVARPLVMAGH